MLQVGTQRQEMLQVDTQRQETLQVDRHCQEMLQVDTHRQEVLQVDTHHQEMLQVDNTPSGDVTLLEGVTSSKSLCYSLNSLIQLVIEFNCSFQVRLKSP